LGVDPATVQLLTPNGNVVPANGPKVRGEGDTPAGEETNE